RGKGLLFGIELVEDKITKEPAASEKLDKIISFCKKEGLIIGKNGDTVAGFNNILQLSPPLSMTDDDLKFIVNTVKKAIAQLRLERHWDHGLRTRIPMNSYLENKDEKH